MALIKICDTYEATGVLAGISYKAMKDGTLARTGPDRGGNTLVDDAAVAGLPH